MWRLRALRRHILRAVRAIRAAKAEKIVRVACQRRAGRVQLRALVRRDLIASIERIVGRFHKAHSAIGSRFVADADRHRVKLAVDVLTGDTVAGVRESLRLALEMRSIAAAAVESWWATASACRAASRAERRPVHS